MKNIFISLLIILFTCSCWNTEEKHLAALHGKTINIKQFIDSINGQSLPQHKHRLVVYIDSNDCFSCILDINAWKLFEKRILKRTNQNIEISFIVSPIYKNTIKDIRFINSYNIYIDNGYNFKKTYRLPDNFIYRTFLLDSLNRVTIIGNPLFNSKIEELICKTLGKN